MRVTNSMINRNSMRNMNANKVNVNKLNNQMSSQKKISRPSEDPVVAIRALRLRSNLSELNQYYEKNIPDAQSWMEVTEDALENMKQILESVRTQCVNGANDTLTQEDRNAILKNLQSLREQIYAEGNADFAGRSVFTGFKTNSSLTFLEDESNTTYTMTEPLSYKKIEENPYYGNLVDVSDVRNSLPGGTVTNPTETTNNRIRLSYENLGDLGGLNYQDASGNMQDLNGYAYTDSTGASHTVAVNTSVSYDDWAANGYQVGDDEVLYFKETGELVLGKDIANHMKSSQMNISAEYTKTGFKEGELRPENYFDCQNTTDPANVLTYTKENQEISYTVAFNQELVVNTQGSDVFDSSIGRDVDELTNAVQAAISAHDKVAELEAMKEESQFSDEASQQQLDAWIKAANKEAAYADNRMKNLYSQGMGDFEEYMGKVTLANTDLGSRMDRLSLTKNRVSNQQATFEQLKSTNEDMELSDIIIEYTSAYTAYQSSLQASAKANSQTLLDYL